MHGTARKGHAGETAPRPLAGRALALIDMLELCELGAAGHSRRVARLAGATARRLGLPERLVTRIGLAGALHDVGKLGVSPAVLRKPGGLSEEDWMDVRRHPDLGAHMLERAGLDDLCP